MLGSPAFFRTSTLVTFFFQCIPMMECEDHWLEVFQQLYALWLRHPGFFSM